VDERDRRIHALGGEGEAPSRNQADGEPDQGADRLHGDSFRDDFRRLRARRHLHIVPGAAWTGPRKPERPEAPKDRPAGTSSSPARAPRGGGFSTGCAANPVPIHEIARRWIARYEKPGLAPCAISRRNWKEFEMSETAAGRRSIVAHRRPEARNQNARPIAMKLK
jgi:hypothetical protein